MPYRFELAKSGRAVCQNGPCKSAGIKIGKGELRYGTLVTIQEHDSWRWRHWGCVTPKQIENLLESIGGLEGLEDDLNVIDGFDEVGEESQEKIVTALKEGHIPDEDWKWEPELNRPGAPTRRPASRKKKSDDDGDEADTEGKSKGEKGRRTKATSTGAGRETEDLPSSPKADKKTKKAPSKKRKAKAAGDEVEDEPAADSGEVPTIPKKKSGHIALMEAGNKEPEPEEENPKPSRKRRAKKAKIEDNHDGMDLKSSGDEDVKAPKQTAKKDRGKKKDAVAETKADDVDVRAKGDSGAKTEVKKSAAIKARGKKAADEVGEAADEGVNVPAKEAVEEKPKPKATGRRTKAK